MPVPSHSEAAVNNPGTPLGAIPGGMLRGLLWPNPPASCEGWNNRVVNWRRPFLVCLAIGCAALAACGSGGGVTAGSPRPITRIVAGQPVVGGRSQLTFRPVLQQLPATGPPGLTPRGQVTTTWTVVLASRDPSGHVTARYELGPVVLDGRVINHAAAHQNQAGQWEVDFYTTTQGSAAFDAMAVREYLHLVAVVVGDLVLSAPMVNATAFHGSGIIAGGFTRQEAKTIAQILNSPG